MNIMRFHIENCKPQTNHPILLGFLVVGFLFTSGAYAVDSTDTFTSDPTGGGMVTAITTPLFVYTFSTTGDGGDMNWNNGGVGDGNSNCITAMSAAYNTGTTEKITITKNGGGYFQFKRIWIDNAGSVLTITVKNGAATIGYLQISTPAQTTVDFGGGLLGDSVELTSTDINIFFDTVTANLNPPLPAVVSNVAVPANATYKAGQNLDFTVNWDQSVTVITTGGTPYIGLTVGSSGKNAPYISGSPGTALLFRYTVQPGDLDTDGIALAANITINGGSIETTTGGAFANTTLNNIGSTANVKVDAVSPTVTSVSVPAAGTYSLGQNLDFTINWSENVTVNTGGGTPSLGLTIGSSGVIASYLSGSPGTALLFRYTVQSGDLDTDGIAVGALSLNGGTIRDSATNTANLTLNGVGSTANVKVDAIIPSAGVTILSPNGGEIWQSGTTYDIVYSATGTIQSASLYYSTNAGSSWNYIAGPVSVTNGTNIHSWLIPSASSATCLVRVVDASDGEPWDVSDNVFSIQTQSTPTPTVTPTPTSTPTPTLTPTSTPVVTQTPSNAAWTLVSTTGPSKRYSHEMAFDPNLGKVVLYGGFDGENALNDTWTWNGSFWTRVSNGPLRLEHAMSYDESRNKIVLFGGSPDNATVINDTWEWDGIQWTQKAVTGPSPRYGSAMAYDSIRGKIVLFGGCANITGTPTLNDTWEWDGTQWTQISSSGPSPRGGHTMVCDSHRGRIVLFGGNNNTVFLRDTWEWDGTTWTQVASTGPTARSNQSSSYDIGLDKVLIFGGIPTPGQRLCDTWVWDAFQWTQVATTGPQNRCAFAMAYNTARGKTILFGGSGLSYNRYNDTWVYGLPSSPEIEILSPNGAEVWQVGTTHNVVFSATGEIQSASIYFSTNMGSSWNFIAGPVSVSSGTNTYPWLIPSVSSTNCLIRVSGEKKGDVFDVSDNCLTINQLYSSLKLEPFNPFVFRNQNTELSVRISDITSLVGYRVALNLDPSKVTYIDGSATKVGTSTETGWGPIVVNSGSPELAIFSCASASGTILSGSASLMKFQLHVNGSLPDFTPISVTFNPLTSLNEDAIAYSAEIWNATVIGPNIQPSFTSGGPVCVAEDCGPQTIAWATDIVPGPYYESWQSLFFTVEGYSPILFSATPEIDPSGVLRFTPAPNANGITSATVYLHDSGGTENGGISVSAAHSLIISVTPVNDAPSFIHGSTVTIVNMMPPMVHLFPSYATGITAGAPDEYGQLLNFLVSNNHPEKFIIQPMIFGSVGIQSSTMVIMPATNAHGVIQAQICLYDNGGQDLGGVNHSATESFTIRLYKRFWWGDLNANDQAGSVDASLLLQYNAELITDFPGYPSSEYPEYYPPYYSAAFPPAADVNCDGIAGTLDASLILQKYVFLIDHVPNDYNGDGWGPDSPILPGKVTMRSVERRLTVSVEGQGSSWIVKFKLDNALDLSGMRLVLLYDPAQVSVDEKAAQWLVPNGMLVTNNLQEGRFIVAGALSIPLGEGSSELMSVKFDRIADSPSSIVIRLDEAMTQFNDGQIQLTPNSAMVFDLLNPTHVQEWMVH